ncbi:MAG: DUF4367 domain-containing protein [Ruminiclostridium sp.]|nr:DUF4367 domain-containing protein [Ruminiclostridium sp.]
MDELLCKAFDEVYEHEFDKYKIKRFHVFSLRHRRMMKKLFKELETKRETESPSTAYQCSTKRKRPGLLIVAIIFSVLLSVTAAAYAVCSFGFKRQPDHTIAFSENLENAPTEIIYIYVIDPLPDNFKECTVNTGLFTSNITYKNGEEYLALKQIVKKRYRNNYNTEGYEIEKIEVNGYDGFYIDFGTVFALVWDNGDYILEIQGTFDKNELLKLAKNVKPQETLK